MFKTPVLFLVFNRPDETEKVFEVIRSIAPKRLYIAADGPRYDRKGEPELCKRVREIVTDIDWECEVKTLFREKNLGCKYAVSEAINWFFLQEERGVILEDDCIPDLTFFPYCEQLLEKYKDDEQIISISGTNLGYEFRSQYSYGFSRFMNMWGWATWRRSAKLIDYDMKVWKKMAFKSFFLQRKLQKNFFAFDYNWVKFWLYHFNETAFGKIDTWDYQWIFTQLYYNKVSIFPAKNLIKNIGFSNLATHTFHLDHPVSELSLKEIIFPLTNPLSKKINILYENKFIKKKWFIYKKESLYRIIRSNFLNSAIISKITNLLRKNCNEKFESY
jgi:hypothetical protein